jgi:hypothetical protein
MILSSDKVADADQPQIEMKIANKDHRVVGQGDSVIVEEIEIFGRTYHRVANHGDVTWEDENNGSIDEELEMALECGYREKFFDTEKTINGTQ